ncbi:MAG: hypothetical protein CBR30_08970 [Dictyoglomus sp. NZ13-RE01]|nr:MAG: hypothetical protein CBR30_08970 [Dictyoglomus sp. NZ13-RE01]
MPTSPDLHLPHPLLKRAGEVGIQKHERFFSISQGYHWAFLVIGLALLGSGSRGKNKRIREGVLPKNKKGLDKSSP